MGLYALAARRDGQRPRDVDQCDVLDHRGLFHLQYLLHARVEANWFGAELLGVSGSRWPPRSPPAPTPWSCASSASLISAGAGAAVGGRCSRLIVQANTGALSGYRRDATARSVGVGWRRAGFRDRSSARTGRRDLRAGAGLRHHRLARVSFAGLERVVVQQEPAHPITCPSRIRHSLPASCFMSTRSGPSITR